MFADYEPNIKYDEANKHAHVEDFQCRYFTKPYERRIITCICAYVDENAIYSIAKKNGIFAGKSFFRVLSVVVYRAKVDKISIFLF